MKTSSTSVKESGRAGYATDEERWQAVVQKVAFLLSVPGMDFTGGEFVLTEQRPRMQSRAEVLGLQRIEAEFKSKSSMGRAASVL